MKAALQAAALQAAALVLLLAAPAHAWVLYEDPLEGDSASLGGTTRLYNLVLWGGPLSSPLAGPDANPSAVSIAALRPWFELKRSWGLKLVVHDELVSTTSSSPSSDLGGSISFGQGRGAPVWLPLQWTAVNDPTYQLTDRIDWAYARYSNGDVAFTVGRQPVTLGRGQIWTPEDLIAPFSPLQIDNQYKPGADAARFDWTVSDSLTLLVVGSAAENGDSAVLSRLEVAVDKLRVGVLAGSVRTDIVAGLDLFLDLGSGTDLHGEGTATWVTDQARRPWGHHAFARAVLGITTELSSTLHLTAEAYYNGAGAPSAPDYVVELTSPRLAVGESYTLGRLYAGVASDWEPHPLVHVELAALGNLEDPSVIVAPTVRYSIAQNASLIAGAYLPLGQDPDYSSLVPIAKSEFGLYPTLAHLDAKLWF